VLDDHSRDLLGAKACQDECEATVRERLARVFERYGLPDAMITDNGNPPILKLWGQQNGPTRLTRLSVWLIRLGIRPLWSRPRQPQTMGKLERLHRTLKAELLQGRRFLNFAAAQAGLDSGRRHDNHERPHDTLDGDVPASRYLMSPRSMPATLPEPIYLDDDVVGRIRNNGCLHCRPDGRRPAVSHRWSLPCLVQPLPHRRGRFHDKSGAAECHPCVHTPVTLDPGPHSLP
jgi:hypothetical protein